MYLCLYSESHCAECQYAQGCIFYGYADWSANSNNTLKLSLANITITANKQMGNTTRLNIMTNDTMTLSTTIKKHVTQNKVYRMATFST